MEKAHIIAEIQRTARDNGGSPVGQRRFEKETGISPHKWRGKFWRQWSDALIEAGFTAIGTDEAYEPTVLVEHLASLTKASSRFPTYADIELARQKNDSFPGRKAFQKHLGNRDAWIDLVRAFAQQHAEYHEILAFLPASDHASSDGATDSRANDGFVYMGKMGKHYKIGRTNAFPRRHRELQLELPEKLERVHVIATDDPEGIEAYWHRRFAEKQTNGEWFALSREDIAVFRRRKFM